MLMRVRKVIAILSLLILSTFFASAEEQPGGGQVHYKSGSQGSFQGPEKNFTGTVQVEALFPKNDQADFSGAYVTFQPGARSAWHSHPAGQHIVVTDGVCLTGTRDGRILRCKTGDAVWCPPNTDHWHGATPDRAMTHLVITGVKDGQNVVWKEKVTDEEYNAHRALEKTTMKIDEQLSKKQQAMVPIAAFTAKGDMDKLKTAFHQGLDAGLTVNEAKEIPIHLYAYAGFPRALNGLGALMSVVEERKARGVEDEVGPDASPLPEGWDSLRQGTKVQTELSGSPVEGPLFDFAPVANEYLRSHLFGDIFARDILDYSEREIVTVAALSSMEGVESQLGAHIRISQNAGLSKMQLSALAAVLKSRVGEQEGLRVEEALR